MDVDLEPSVLQGEERVCEMCNVLAFSVELAHHTSILLLIRNVIIVIFAILVPSAKTNETSAILQDIQDQRED